MQSNFSEACRDTRAGIAVPPVPLAAIRSRAAQTATPRRAAHLRAVVIAGFAVALLAAVTATWEQTRVWVGDGHVLVTAEHGAMIHNPTAADLRSAAQAADFPVVLPTGLPDGSVPITLFKGGKSALMIEYRLPGARNHSNIAWVVVANPKSFDIKRANSLPQGDLQHAQSLQVGEHIVAIFPAHDEMVVVPKGALRTHELNVMEQAMGEGQGRHVAAGGAFVENPTPDDLEAAARAVAFRAVLPAGLPVGTKTIFVGRLNGRILIQYSLPGAWRASNHIATIVLAAKSDTAAERETLAMMPHRTIALRFDVGNEMVLIPSSSLTNDELARIRQTMAASNRT